jgi:hypothetical protein
MKTFNFQVSDKVMLRESHNTNLEELHPGLRCGVIYCVEAEIANGGFIHLAGIIVAKRCRVFQPGECFRLVHRGSGVKAPRRGKGKGGV